MNSPLASVPQSQPLHLHGSIRDMAEQLVAALPADAERVRGRSRTGIEAELRRLSRRAGGARSLIGPSELELTGGVEIATRVPPCAHDPYHGYLSGRLGPGWTVERLTGRVEYMIANAFAQADLRRKRDGLYSLLEQLRFAYGRGVLAMAMAEEEAVSGHASELVEMGADDVRYWSRWLRVWADLHALNSLDITHDM